MRQKWLQKPPLGTPINFSHPSAKGLMLDLEFQEGGGDLANDLSGNANHGTLKNMAFPPTSVSGWNAGRKGTALSFDGSNDYVNCGTISLAGNTSWTVSMWIKPDAISTQGLYGNAYVPGKYTRFYFNTTKLSLYNDSNNKLGEWNVALSANVWQYLVLVCDYSITDLILYIDGVSKGNYDFIVDNSQTIKMIGGYGSASSGTFNGQIDQVRIYNRALPETEIIDSYFDTFGMFERNNLWDYVSSGQVVDVFLALTQSKLLSSSGSAIINAGVALTRADSVASSGPSTANAALSLAYLNTTAQNGDAIAEGLLTLTNYLAIINTASKDITATVSLPAGCAITQSASSIAEGTLATALYLAVAQEGSSVVNRAITLSHSLAVIESSGDIHNMAIALAHAQSLTQTAQSVASGALSLNEMKTVSSEAVALSLAALILSQQNVISSAYGTTISAQIGLAIQEGINISVCLDVHPLLGLTQSFGISAHAQAAAEGTFTLNQLLGLTIIGEAIANANLTLNNITSITVTATAIIVGLVTPDKRTATIQIELRDTDIPFESRTVSIP